MTQGHPARLMLLFALPLMAGNVFQQLYTVVDTAIVGQGVGMQALAALGTVDWLNWMIIGAIQGFTQGFGVRMSQKFGQKDVEGLKRTIASSFLLSAMITLILVIATQLSLPLFLHLLRVPQELRPIASGYTRVIFSGIPGIMFYNFCASVLRAVGDSRTPLVAMIIASATNITLDCLAVFVLQFGVTGAAVATVISQCVAGGCCWLKIWRSDNLRLEKRHFTAGEGNTLHLLGLGTPMAAQNVIISIGGMVLQSVVNSFGTVFIAGFTATNKLYGLLEIAAVSYGFAVTTYTGQNYGAAKWRRIRSGTNWAAVVSVITAALIAACMLIFGRPITMLFISGDLPEVERAAGEVAYQYLTFMSLSLPILYLLYVYRSALQGMGNMLIPMLSGAVEFVMRVGLALYVGAICWKEGLFLAEISAWGGAAVLLIVSYYFAAHKLKEKI